jgi:phytoene dehydrogenase-like protein
MNESGKHDAVIVGSGPNGLAAAITLAEQGLRVLLIEGSKEPGGGIRSAEMTLPGFSHDVCSAVYPMAVGSPFFRSLPLADHGLKWIDSPAPLAHPLDDGSAVLLERSVEATAAGLGPDGEPYVALFRTLVDNWKILADELLAPIHFPRHPFLLARFGLSGLRSARGLARVRFKELRSRALLAGLAGHSFLPLESAGSAAFALMLGLFGHAVGWPIVQGGSGQLARSLTLLFQRYGGEIRSGHPVRSTADLPPARATLFDLSPRQFNALVGGGRGRTGRRFDAFRFGPGVFKVDWALDGPIPWKAAACLRAATVHVGGTFDDIAISERAVGNGTVSDRPFVLVAQPTLFDPGRAPKGREIAWGYCHVPNGSNEDQLSSIEGQVERFAPGFRERVLSRHTFTAGQLENYNPNYIGGDISGGANDLGQLFARPGLQWEPYETGIKGYYLCSASTPPGGGVHGMCGFHAARAALLRTFGRRLGETADPGRWRF